MAKSRTTFSKENPRPGPGRKRLTEEQKRLARLQRAVDYDYKAHLRSLLPIATDLIEKRLIAGTMEDSNVIRASEMMRDTVHGKPAQTIQGPGGGPLVGTFAVLLGTIDGAKVEKLHGDALRASNGNGNGHSHEKL
mgnify:CR=1 FL=1